MFTLLLAYLFYCMIECPCVNILNWSQGKIFYDIEHVQSNEKLSSLQNKKQHSTSSMMMMANGGGAGNPLQMNNVSTVNDSLDQLNVSSPTLVANNNNNNNNNNIY